MKNQRSVEQNTDSPCWHVSRTEVVSVSTKPITNKTESPTLVLTFHPHRLPGPLSMPSHRLLTGRSCYHFQYRQTSWASTLPALPHKLLYISRQNRIFLGSSLPHCVGWFPNHLNHNMFISQAVSWSCHHLRAQVQTTGWPMTGPQWLEHWVNCCFFY